MKTAFVVVAITLFAVFLSCVIAQPFAWRLGSRPGVSLWLNRNLPPWVIARLNKKEKDDQNLCFRFVRWIGLMTWIAMAVFIVLTLSLSSAGLYR